MDMTSLSVGIDGTHPGDISYIASETTSRINEHEIPVGQGPIRTASMRQGCVFYDSSNPRSASIKKYRYHCLGNSPPNKTRPSPSSIPTALNSRFKMALTSDSVIPNWIFSRVLLIAWRVYCEEALTLAQWCGHNDS
jgi:hypothetical protein